MGGGSKAPAQQNVTQTNLPEYARPYFERLMARTEAASNEPYQQYRGARVADFTPMQTNAMQNVADMGRPTQIAGATNLTNQAAQGALDSTNFQAGRIGSTYNPNALAGQQERVQSTFAPGQFNGATADQYMNPYQQRVTDIAKREAIRQHGIAGVARDATAAQRGSFGGSRAALQQMEAERNLGQQLDDIQMRGSSDAYQNAQQQFERDRAAQKDAASMGLGAQQFNAQQRMAYGQFDEQGRQKAAEMGMQGQIANEQARAAAAGIQQKGYGMAGELGGQLGNLGKLQQDTDLQRAQAQYGMGAQEQGLRQQALDVAYDDFVNQRDAQKQNLAFYSGILRGVPVQANSNTVTTQAGGNNMSQLAGLGIAGLGAYNMYKGG